MLPSRRRSTNRSPLSGLLQKATCVCQSGTFAIPYVVLTFLIVSKTVLLRCIAGILNSFSIFGRTTGFGDGSDVFQQSESRQYAE